MGADYSEDWLTKKAGNSDKTWQEVADEIIAQATTAIQTSATGITAFATGGQASAVALTADFNEITTVATSGDSVKLMAAAANAVQIVKNDGANNLAVFPATGDTINDGVVNASYTISPGSMVTFRAVDGTNWETGSAIDLLSVKLQNGTVGAPAYSFSNSTDMGLYRISATQLGITVGGVLQAVVDTTGILTARLTEAVQGTGLEIQTLFGTPNDGDAGGPITIASASGSNGLGGNNGGDGGHLHAGAGTGGNSTDDGGWGGNMILSSGGGGTSTSGVAGNGGAGGTISIVAGAGGAASAGTGDGGVGGGIYLLPGTGGTSAGGTAGTTGPIVLGGVVLQKQIGPASKTTDATLTVAEILRGMVTVNQGAAGTSAQQLPTGADLTTALPDVTAGGNWSFDFSVINTSVVAAEDVTITTNTDWTLVGSMVIEANDNDRARSSAIFRARNNAGTNTWILYRIS